MKEVYMVGWTGLTGKIIEFVATKLIGKSIDLTLDKKARAAKTFMRLYNSLVKLEIILSEIISVFDDATVRQKPVIFSKMIVPILPRVGEASKGFLDSFAHAIQAIYIFDPNLAAMLQVVRGGKFQGLTALGKALERAEMKIEFSGKHPFTSINYTRIDNILSQVNLEETYNRLQPISNMTNIENNQNAINDLTETIQSGIVQDIIHNNDFEKVALLLADLKVHLLRMTEAREALRFFISSTFTMEDLLAYSDEC